MYACAFFGHRDCGSEVSEKIYSAARRLIEQNQVTQFYVGNHGQFDALSLRALKRLKAEFSFIRYSVVLAYMPASSANADAEELLVPDGLETVPPRYAILKRNKWMVENSDFVICFITRGWGGAAQSVKQALHKNKTVINLANEQ